MIDFWWGSLCFVVYIDDKLQCCTPETCYISILPQKNYSGLILKEMVQKRWLTRSSKNPMLLQYPEGADTAGPVFS